MVAGCRVDQPSEEIAFRAHKGTCGHCGGLVKMERDMATLALKPEACRCLLCGQPYHVVAADMAAWEREQWLQKEEETRHA